MFLRPRLLRLTIVWLLLGTPSLATAAESISDLQNNRYSKLLDRFASAENSKGYSSLTSKEQFYLCKHLMDTVVTRIQRLAKFSKDPYASSRGKIGQVLRHSVRDCQNSNSRYEALQTINLSFNDHENKIGVLLPLNGPYAQLARATLEGMKSAAISQGVKFDRFFVVLDTSSSKQGTESALAKLLLSHNVSMVIGGLTKVEAGVIEDYSKHLRFSSFILNASKELYLDNKNGFQVFPNPRNQADAIVANWQAHGVKEAAILRPSHGASDDLIDRLMAIAPEAGIAIVDDIEYLAGDYPQMNLAVERLFKLTLEDKTKDRRVEFEDLLKEKEEEAKKEEVSFNPDRVFLPPQVDFQAIVIPDDFRVMRHFVKLFKFHNVENMRIAGNHMWRSPEMITPWDPYLADSFFVDFIGKYSQLPIRANPYLRTGTASKNNKSFFLDPEQVVEFDYKLVGFRSSEITMDILRLRVEKRRDIAARAKSMLNTSKHWRDLKFVFDSQRSSNWSISTFALSKDQLSIIPTHKVRRLSSQQNAPRFNKQRMKTSQFKAPSQDRKPTLNSRFSNSH